MTEPSAEARDFLACIEDGSVWEFEKQDIVKDADKFARALAAKDAALAEAWRREQTWISREQGMTRLLAAAEAGQATAREMVEAFGVFVHAADRTMEDLNSSALDDHIEAARVFIEAARAILARPEVQQLAGR
mgnify:CR=1 FL=1